MDLAIVITVVVVALAYFGWTFFRPAKLPDGFAASNGRIEATEIDIATKLAERIKDELVDEGDFVTAGDVVANMDTDVLEAQLNGQMMGVSKEVTVVADSTKLLVEKKVTRRVTSSRNEKFARCSLSSSPLSST